MGSAWLGSYSYMTKKTTKPVVALREHMKEIGIIDVKKAFEKHKRLNTETPEGEREFRDAVVQELGCSPEEIEQLLAEEEERFSKEMVNILIKGN